MGIEDKNLDNVEIEIPTDKTKIKKLYEIIKKHFHDVIVVKGDETMFRHTRNFMKKWYLDNPGKHFYEEIPLSQRKMD